MHEWSGQSSFGTFVTWAADFRPYVAANRSGRLD